jgi:hypothetical protein
MSSRSVAYRWTGEDGAASWLLILPTGQWTTGTSETLRAANRSIGDMSRAGGSPLTVLRLHHPNDPRVADA